jgi:hypothetical protein
LWRGRTVQPDFGSPVTPTPPSELVLVGGGPQVWCCRTCQHPRDVGLLDELVPIATAPRGALGPAGLDGEPTRPLVPVPVGRHTITLTATSVRSAATDSSRSSWSMNDEIPTLKSHARTEGMIASSQSRGNREPARASVPPDSSDRHRNRRSTRVLDLVAPSPPTKSAHRIANNLEPQGIDDQESTMIRPTPKDYQHFEGRYQ